MMVTKTSQKTNPWLQLVIAFTCITIVWMSILPRIGQLPSVRKRIESNQAAGINPTAVFYTDHPGMRQTERKIESIVYHMDGVFWSPFRP